VGSPLICHRLASDFTKADPFGLTYYQETL
jgi:hypothetical protein